MSERKHPVRMPDGTVTYDLDEYGNAWRALGEPVEKLLPLYEIDAWDPDVRFTLKTLGTPHSFSMPVPAVRQLADSVAKIEAERDEARAEAARLREYLENEVGTSCDAATPEDFCGVAYPMKTYCCLQCRTRLFLEGKEP